MYALKQTVTSQGSAIEDLKLQMEAACKEIRERDLQLVSAYASWCRCRSAWLTLGVQEQAQLESTRKWRVQERNDWKALVAALQQDRSRLEAELEKQHAVVAALQQQLAAGSDRAAAPPTVSSGHQPATAGAAEVAPDRDAASAQQPEPTAESQPSSPHAAPPAGWDEAHSLRTRVQQLERELERARQGHEEHRIQTVAEMDSMADELRELRAEVARYRAATSKRGFLSSFFTTITEIVAPRPARRAGVRALQV